MKTSLSQYFDVTTLIAHHAHHLTSKKVKVFVQDASKGSVCSTNQSAIPYAETSSERTLKTVMFSTLEHARTAH